MTYKLIVVENKPETDSVLAKQISMLSERHHAEVVYLNNESSFDNGKRAVDNVLAACEDRLVDPSNALYICSARNEGACIGAPFETKTIENMKEAYQKAMDMLKAFQGEVL